MEAGHQIFLSNFTPEQSCTNHNNCWASLASGDGIEKRFGTTKYQCAKDIFSHVLTSHDLNELREINAIAFGNLINMYDPDVIIIMGSVGTEQFSSIIPSPNQVAKYSINRPVPPVEKSALVGQTGVIGAFYVARDLGICDLQS
jgi:predicted NBD/HSP70 family sugar kinase